MKNVLITTSPFGKINKAPINLLKKNNINFYSNPKNKKFSRNELLNIAFGSLIYVQKKYHYFVEKCLLWERY